MTDRDDRAAISTRATTIAGDAVRPPAKIFAFPNGDVGAIIDGQYTIALGAGSMARLADATRGSRGGTIVVTARQFMDRVANENPDLGGQAAIRAERRAAEAIRER